MEMYLSKYIHLRKGPCYIMYVKTPHEELRAGCVYYNSNGTSSDFTCLLFYWITTTRWWFDSRGIWGIWNYRCRHFDYKKKEKMS